jgi:hypothetical protein
VAEIPSEIAALVPVMAGVRAGDGGRKNNAHHGGTDKKLVHAADTAGPIPLRQQKSGPRGGERPAQKNRRPG